MTDIQATGNDGRRRAGVARPKRLAVRIDMTPMVDLGFLLIAFFVMTTRLSQPTAVKLNMPKEGPAILLGNSNALTVLLDDNDRVYYYQGEWKDAVAKGEIFATNFSVKDGLGKVIREKQQWLETHRKKEGRDGLMLMIKASKGASYQNVMDAIDETLINIVKKYALLPPDSEELNWIDKQKGKTIF